MNRPAVWIGMVIGGTLALALFAPSLSELKEELSDPNTQIFWYMGRSSGFVAYWLLFLAVVVGLGVSSRVFDGLLARTWVFEIHKFLSIFVLVAMVLHALILLPDPFIKFKLSELFVPFTSPYRNTGVALGIIVLYSSTVLAASFYLKAVIGELGWRMLHYLTFGAFVVAMAHGLLSGTDSGEAWAQTSYLASGLLVLFLTFFRILASRDLLRIPFGRRPAAGEEPAGQVGPAGGEPAPAAEQG